MEASRVTARSLDADSFAFSYTFTATLRPSSFWQQAEYTVQSLHQMSEARQPQLSHIPRTPSQIGLLQETGRRPLPIHSMIS